MSTSSQETTSQSAVTDTPDLLKGRLLVLAASVMWSSSGLFVKVPIFDDFEGVHRGMFLAFWRAVFAALVLFPMARGIRWRWGLVPMTACFAGMNATYVSAMVFTTAANAIWLQNTAPFWVLLIGVSLLGERVKGRDVLAFAASAVGVGVILLGLRSEPAAGTDPAQNQIGMILGLVSGGFYAGIMLSLRQLRGENSIWLISLNQASAAVVLLPLILYLELYPQNWLQLVVLIAFGAFQIGIPYCLFANGLKHLAAHEAGQIALLEPLLVPVWAYAASGEIPANFTMIGGGLIFVALLLRYVRLPRSK